MKIAIDCADLDHSRIDGTRVYIKNLLQWFGAQSQDSFFLYHKKDFNHLLSPSWHSNYIDRKIPYSFWWTQTRFAFELRKDNPDVCWMPIQQIPFIGPKKTKYVVTIHDLAFKIFKDHFTFKDRLKLNFFADTAIRKADKIIAISESTKKDIIKFYPKISEDKIEVIYHGFDEEEFSKKCSEEEKKKLFSKYKISENIYNDDEKYILYVGAIQPRKNLSTLIKAFEEIKKNKKESRIKLVLVGEPAWLSDEIIEQAEKSEFKQDIIRTGRVDFDELRCFYQAADVFVYPSLYEGFGIPILEAFASETPVVIANNSSLPEVGGDAAKTFSSTDFNELATVLQNILNNRTIREEMIEKGKQKAREFSWEKCAKETLELIKK